MIWKNIATGWGVCQKGLVWQVTQGTHTNFWHDNWLAHSLNNRSLIHGPLTEQEQNIIVAHALNTIGNSNQIMSLNLPTSIIQRITEYYIPPYSILPYRIIWGHTLSGLFSVSSCYKMLIKSNELPNHHGWIWHLRTLPKIKILFWLLSHSRLPTQHYLHILGILPSTICTICQQEAETIPHIFFKCVNAQKYWLDLQLRLLI